MKSISKGEVPSVWKQQYVSAAENTASAWIVDLSARVKALSRYQAPLRVGAPEKEVNDIVYWVGGMFSPEAFITATRQYTAQVQNIMPCVPSIINDDGNNVQVNKWSLEELELYLEIGPNAGARNDQIGYTTIEGLVLESAKWSPSKDSKSSAENLELSSDLRCMLPPSRLRWCRRADRPQGDYLPFPIYRNDSRTSLIAEVLVCLPMTLPKYVWAQRGTGFLLQAML